MSEGQIKKKEGVCGLFWRPFGTANHNDLCRSVYANLQYIQNLFGRTHFVFVFPVHRV